MDYGPRIGRAAVRRASHRTWPASAKGSDFADPPHRRGPVRYHRCWSLGVHGCQVVVHIPGFPRGAPRVRIRGSCQDPSGSRYGHGFCDTKDVARHFDPVNHRHEWTAGSFSQEKTEPFSPRTNRCSFARRPFCRDRPSSGRRPTFHRPQGDAEETNIRGEDPIPTYRVTGPKPVAPTDAVDAGAAARGERPSVASAFGHPQR